MDYKEHQLTLVIGGQEINISPITNPETVITDSGDKLSDILDRYVPIEIDKQSYLDLVNSNAVDLNKLYMIKDDVQSITISDLVVSRSSTFSSQRIMELFANGGDLQGTSSNGPNTLTVKVNKNNWVANGKIKTYLIPIAVVTNTSLVSVNVSNRLSDDDYEAQLQIIKEASIQRIKQSPGYIVLYAYGNVPTMDIDLDIVVYN